MRTITTTIKAFKFEELSERAKRNALERFYDINVDYQWWELAYDTIRDLAKMSGIKGFEISGFDTGRSSSICLSGYIHYSALQEFAKNEPKEKGFKLLESIQETAKNLLVQNLCPSMRTAIASGYHKDFGCEFYGEFKNYRDDTSTDWYFDIDTENDTMLKQSELCAVACSDFLDEFKDVAFRMLSNEYEYLTSEEAIIDTIKANEYEFTEDGQLI